MSETTTNGAELEAVMACVRKAFAPQELGYAERRYFEGKFEELFGRQPTDAERAAFAAEMDRPGAAS